MPLHHFRCDRCGCIVEEYRSIQEGGNARLPTCPDCADFGDLQEMYWCVPVVAVDAREPFQRFQVSRQVPTTNGLREQIETIDTVHKLRQIEKDSEQRYRDGEGEPVRFRAWNQDASNKDVSSFGTAGSIGDRTYDSGLTPQKKSNISVIRHGETKPDRPLGPGLRHATSPLKG